MNSCRKYVIRNRDEEAWLANVSIEKGLKTFHFLPNAGKAIQYETKMAAEWVAKECKGKVQILRKDRNGKYYSEG